ncbi:hypothetical protein K461DRAFT_270124 [Myriangium duriaei CBS 260.36]|uniref:Uncharacterized protein n=1 Tax=Myriangium duriaei CBS 260.36 TaxID=1168546 RepID=A0A9P4MKE4_9PEZI|nr:hypothetical protein K461DRAFT_270124 [Myriangium duriaei CBS 260.36]
MAGDPNEVFRQLKGPCVTLNQSILSFQGRNAPPGLVVHCAEDLLRILKRFKAGDLNSRLAEYVFIPLSYILKSSQQLPIRASEVAFESLALLLESGWREQVVGPLGSQLLILLAITADRTDKVQKSREPTGELLQAVYECFYHLFYYLERTKGGRSQLQEASVVPHLGHAVTVILDGISSSDSSDAESQAARALGMLLRAVDDPEMLASFLPGIVSSLTKVLTPATRARRSAVLLQQCLQVLNDVFKKTVSTHAIADIYSRKKSQNPDLGTKSRPLDSSWLEATAGQMKLALANINKLRSHSRVDVRKALIVLDLTILNDCGETLPNCQQLCIESLVVLLEDEQFHEIKAQVTTMIQTTPRLLESLETILRDWTMSLPRILEGSDEDKKTRRLQQLFTTYSLLQDSVAPTQSLQQLISTSLPDYVAIIIRTCGQDKSTIAQTPAVRLENLPVALRSDRTVSFPDAVSSSRFQTDVLNLLQRNLPHLATPDLAIAFATQVRESSQDMQVSAMWLTLRLIQPKQNSAIADFLNIEDDDNRLWCDQVRDDLYDFSLTTIEQDEADWRLKALSLEVIAAQATALSQDFRNELIDALYPILHLLGGESPRLRQHAMVCLNIITQACGFADVKALVVDNADYLVNAVALKLNSFDVSPQGPQVLLMMINLAGPSLVPYLEDTVDSIFAVLEDYHGYTTLVELLFSVLNAISEQGVQEALLQLPAPPSTDSYPSLEWHPITIPSLALYLQSRRDSRPPPIDPTSDANPSSNTKEVSPSHPPPQSKTHALLLRLFTSTLPHLPTSSPSLRLLLLSQLRTLIPTLAKHEDSFLPLVAQLWPALVPRLADTEPHTVRATLEVLTALAVAAGGFLKARVREMWSQLRGVERWVTMGEKGQAGEPMRGNAGKEVIVSSRAVQGSGYVDPSFVAVRKALSAFLVAAATWIGLDDEMFEEMLGWVAIGKMEDQEREKLARVNRDAVWLALRRERRTGIDMPGRLLEGGVKWAAV